MAASLAPTPLCSAPWEVQDAGLALLAGHAVGGAGLDPLVHPPYALRERHGGAPAKLAGGALGGDGAALQFARTGPGKRRTHAPAGHHTDYGDQVEHAHLDAGADVPGARAAAVASGEERAD